MARRIPLAASVTFVPILLLHTLFVWSYPLNNRGGDTANYFDMLTRGKSSLVHAGGYPFLIGLPFRHGPLARSTFYSPDGANHILQATQHGIGLAAMVVLFLGLRRFHGSVAASLATLGLGLNVQMLGALSSTYPEWLQASLLIFAAGAAGYAYFQVDGRLKTLWYAFSVALFTWCVLVKFNAAVLAVMYLVPLVAERLPLVRRLFWLGMCLLVALVNVFVYLWFFHYPTTGTHRLTADTAWVLLTKVQSVYDNQLSPAAGPATKRWLALASSLPMQYHHAGPGLFSHLDAVPAEVRAPYRELFAKLVASDDRVLEEWIREHPLPNGFSVGVSPIPVCYYVGLLEGNDLGVKVAFEAIVARPREYRLAVWRDVQEAFTADQFYPLFPTADNLSQFGFGILNQHAGGWVELSQKPPLSNVPYGYDSPVVWWPGARIAGWLTRHTIPAAVLSALIAMAVLFGGLRIFARRRIEVDDGLVLTLAIGLLAFVVASCMILGFRWKELCLALPLIYSLAALGLAPIIRAVVWPLRAMAKV